MEVFSSDPGNAISRGCGIGLSTSDAGCEYMKKVHGEPGNRSDQHVVKSSDVSGMDWSIGGSVLAVP